MQDNYLRRFDFSNKAKRLPVCFCIDTSTSMERVIDGFEATKPTGEVLYVDQNNYNGVYGGITVMDKINEGVTNFYKAIRYDDIACDSCEIAVVTFNDEPALYDGFSSVDKKEDTCFKAVENGNSVFTSAIRMSLDILEKQKAFYKENKITYYQPWLVLFTDGLPSDDVSLIKRELMSMQTGDPQKLTVYTIAFSNKKELSDHLNGYSTIPPITCQNPREIKKIFTFLAQSVSGAAIGKKPAKYVSDVSANKNDAPKKRNDSKNFF